MEKTILQQNELDKIEKRLIITLFGSDVIPEKSAQLMKLLQINPNDYIRKFENLMLPVMDENGMINGKILTGLLNMSKFRNCMKYYSFPDGNFFLSDIIINLIQTFLPGVTL